MVETMARERSWVGIFRGRARVFAAFAMGSS
jgi:hypothetical protein